MTAANRPMMAITTISSTSVKPALRRRRSGVWVVSMALSLL
jgi:hypothetical protein